MRPALSFFAVVLGIGAVACADSTTNARISRLQADQAAHDRSIDEAERDVNRLSARWADVVARYTVVERDYARARRHYEMAAHESAHATVASVAAAKDWRRAEKLWALYRTIVLVAIALEVGRYEGRAFSCQPMTTAAFRQLLISQGRNLVGLDIDHIVPRSLGGADHPMNYRVIDASTNRSLGARWDADKCLMSGRRRCSEALAVSRQCGGYDGPWF